MEEEQNTTLHSKTRGLKRWGTLVLAIFLSIIMLPYFMSYIGFCLKTMEFRKASDNISYWDVISWVKEQNNLNGIENNGSLIRKEVEEYFQKNPKHLGADNYFSNIFHAGERFSTTLTYFLPPSKVVKAKEPLHANNNLINVIVDRPVVGVQIWHSYGVCGHPVYGMTDNIYKGDALEKKYSPYYKDNK